MATGGYIEPEAGSPSFFKVIRYPSAPHLILPKAFVRKYLEKIPKIPTLITATREHSWRLELVRIDEDYCFAHGWEKVVDDVQLCIKDIVVFSLIDPSTFLVTFLGTNGCEKYVPLIKTNGVDDDGHDDVHDDDGHVVGQSDGDEVVSDKNLCFEKVFSSKTFKLKMSLPIKFVKDAGLTDNWSIKLKDHEGKEWTMGIMVEQYERSKYFLSEGWVKFYKHHKLSDGDVCKFIYNKKEGVLNLTQMIKTKRSYCGGRDEIEMDWWPIEKPRGEYESDHEMEVVKRKKVSPRVKSFVNVKVEDESDPVMVVGRGKGGVLSPEKPSRGGGVEVKTKPETERVFRSKHVIYF